MFSKLRDLLEANGLVTKKGSKPSSKYPNAQASAQYSAQCTKAMEIFDKDHQWCGFREENDWCGLGMHVDLKKGELVPIEPLGEVVGHGGTASIDAVRCRGIRLARKTIYLRRGLQLRDALKEVRALHELRHAHIVRLVGTYSQSKSFTMLLYPVADQNLAEHLDELDVRRQSVLFPDRNYMLLIQDITSLSEGSTCLVSALRYIHQQGIKHMDIKPQNILLKDTRASNESYDRDLPVKKKIFLCDFGIAHIFESQDASKTDAFLGRTPKYASPEVAAGEHHGRAADVFSLGCVLLEMNTVYTTFPNFSLSEFNDYRLEGSSTKPYNETVSRCQIWSAKLEDMEISAATIALMLSENPSQRPRLFADSTSQLPALNNPDDSLSSEVSKYDTPNPSRSEVSIVTQHCFHDVDGPEPYIYDKPYSGINEVLDSSPSDVANHISLQFDAEKAKGKKRLWAGKTPK
jgi:serine/threonine protein kinase